MAPEPISTAYLVNASHQSVCCMCIPLSLLGNDLVNRFRINEKFWRRRFLCGPYRIEGTQGISSS
jgi:hypothetical protein